MTLLEQWNATPAAGRWDLWVKMNERERDAVRDTSALHPTLIPYEGKRVRVTPKRKFGANTFRVGRTTGWQPVHLAMRGNAHGSSDTINRDERIDRVTLL